MINVAKVLSEVTYKRGWTFEVLHVEFDCTEILISSPDVEDTGGSGKTFPLRGNVRFCLDPSWSADEFLMWLGHHVIDLEIHESREWFRYRGQLVDDPHAGEHP